jgi:hypothetical protein
MKPWLGLPIFFMICIALAQGKSIHIARLDGDPAVRRSQTVDRLGYKAALSVAKQALRRSKKSPRMYDATLCELRDFWLVIFELKGSRPIRSGPEYVITKEGGQLIDTRIVPHGLRARRTSTAAPKQSIGKAEAISIAQKDATVAYGTLQPYDVVTCELRRAWRIVYDLRAGLIGGGPDYVIDKGTGRIIYKRYAQ